MFPQKSNLKEAMWKSVRVFIVEKDGKLCDRFNRNTNLICEYDPQGMNINVFTGKVIFIYFIWFKSFILLFKFI